jgi:hypothetical protein
MKLKTLIMLGAVIVGSGALLGCLLIVCIFPFLNGSLKLWLQLPAPKPSLLELVKIYLNPRCALIAVRNGVKKLCWILPRWRSITKARMILIQRNIHILDKSAPAGKRNDKLSALTRLNLLRFVGFKNKRISEVRMPEVDTRFPYNERGVLRAISNTYEDGSWITTYAYVEPESEPSRQSIQAHLVEIVKHSKNNGAHEQPNVES